MKKLLFSLLLMSASAHIMAQTITPADRKALQKKEDSLKIIAPVILQGETSEERMHADSLFTRVLVRALLIKNSINYPFDSLVTISKLSPEGKSFKIFTWQMVVNDDLVRQRGAIQMATKDGSLKLFPLVDRSEMMENPADTITDNNNWFGAIYYKMIEKKAFGNTYYTLLGYDENNSQSTIKLIDFLTFKDDKPVFGSYGFSFIGNREASRAARYIMEFKKNASPRLIYDTDDDRIVLEHLIPENGEAEKKYTYIPDGDYDAFKWMDGKWVHIQKIFTEVTPEGKPPIPVPLNAKERLEKLKQNNN